jgi:hypothetical protein
MWYLTDYLLSSDGFMWIIQAVEANIIPTFLKSMHLLSCDHGCFPGDSLEDVYAIILHNVIDILLCSLTGC